MSFTGSASWGSVLRKSALAIAIAACAVTGFELQARPSGADAAVVPLSSLPAEAQETTRLIRHGGPFPHAKDGAVFGNRERLLPPRRRGHYREYTVKTPRARDRGARRIVCGGAQPAQPEVCYYTNDHYASFARIAP